MPLYMDIHTVDSETLSVEDVVKAHMEDLAIQEQFGVTQLKYWVNEDAKTLFCLMTGPDKDACHQVHLQSHGNTACNIIEVSDNEYKLFMGVGNEVNDLAHTQSGELDTGYRTILLTNVVYFSHNKNMHTRKIHSLIKKYKGVLILEPRNEFMVSFIYASDAISCAAEIKTYLKSTTDHIEFNLAIVSGRPVDEQGNQMFEETKKKVDSLCSLGLTKKMFLDKSSMLLANKELQDKKELQMNFSLIQNEDFQLSLDIYNILNENITNSEFSSEDLAKELGLSKSQALRKIKSLTGLTPNQLIQETRLQKALESITHSEGTMAEIAYQVGYNSPAYFTRVFKKRFDILPTEFVKQQVN